MGAFADVLVLLLILCIEQQTVEFFCEDMQKFSIEVTELEIKRDYYLNKLIAKKYNGLIKVITGMCLPSAIWICSIRSGPINENKKERVERRSLFMS